MLHGQSINNEQPMLLYVKLSFEQTFYWCAKMIYIQKERKKIDAFQMEFGSFCMFLFLLPTLKNRPLYSYIKIFSQKKKIIQLSLTLLSLRWTHCRDLILLGRWFLELFEFRYCLGFFAIALSLFHFGKNAIAGKIASFSINNKHF